MTDQVIAHYKNLFDRHGYSSNAVEFRDQSSHLARFQLLAEISHDLGSVLDVGAGLAHFYTYLRAHGFQGRYLGLEFVEQFVESANHLMVDDENAEVRHFDVSTGELPTGFEYGFVSGVFNLARANAEEFMYSTLKNLWEVCEKGMAFNILSTHVEYFDNHLFYVDPEKMFMFLKCELQCHIVMFHDYITSKNGYPYEVTYFARKEPRLIIET